VSSISDNREIENDLRNKEKKMKKVLTIRYHILKRREERINKRKKKPK
jgi:hypothetical protein